eukprot:gene17659-5256_t
MLTYQITHTTGAFSVREPGGKLGAPSARIVMEPITRDPMISTVQPGPFANIAFLSVPVHEQRRLRDWLLKRSSDAAKSSDELQASSSKGKQGDADAAAGEEDAFHSTKRMRTAYKCLLCKRTASYLCSYCCKGWYCSRDCQVEHWVEHRGQCMPEGESLDHEARSNRGSTMYQQIQTQQRMEAAGAGAGAAGGAGGARGPGGEAKNRQRHLATCMCSLCHNHTYCSRDCQLKAWSGPLNHKASCNMKPAPSSQFLNAASDSAVTDGGGTAASTSSTIFGATAASASASATTGAGVAAVERAPTSTAAAAANSEGVAKSGPAKPTPGAATTSTSPSFEAEGGKANAGASESSGKKAVAAVAAVAAGGAAVGGAATTPGSAPTSANSNVKGADAMEVDTSSARSSIKE